MTECIVTSSVLILVVAALRAALKGRISLRLQYALWLVVLLRLLLPVPLFESRFSVMNVVTRTTAADAAPRAGGTDAVLPAGEFALTTPVTSAGTTVGGTQSAAAPEAETAPTEKSAPEQGSGIPLARLARWIWLCGIAVVGLCLLLSNLRFWLRLRRTRQPLAPVSGRRVYLAAGLPPPCLFGLFHPAVYLTPEVAGDPARLSHVMQHELTHYAHGDHVWSLLRGVCVALHWYNPLVWLAAVLSRRDAELACDEGAICRLGESERGAYGRTLIGLVALRRPADLLCCATTMSGGKRTIQERIRLIAQRPRRLAVTALAALLIVAVAVGCTFSGTKTEAAEQQMRAQYEADLAALAEQTVTRVTFHAAGETRTLTGAAEIDPLLALLSRVTLGETADGGAPGAQSLVLDLSTAAGETRLTFPACRIGAVEEPADALFFAAEIDGVDAAQVLNALWPAEDSAAEDSAAGGAAEEPTDTAGRSYTVDEALQSTTDAALFPLAWAVVERDLAAWETVGESPVTITAARLTGLTLLDSVSDAALDLEFRLYLLEYRLKPEDPATVPLAGGSSIEDGWITESSSMGQPVLIVCRRGGTYLSAGTTMTGALTPDGDYDLLLADCWQSATGHRLPAIDLYCAVEGETERAVAALYEGEHWSLYLPEGYLELAPKRLADDGLMPAALWVAEVNPDVTLSVIPMVENEELLGRDIQALAARLGFRADDVSTDSAATISTAGGTMRLFTLLRSENGVPAELLHLMLVPDQLGGCYLVCGRLPYEAAEGFGIRLLAIAHTFCADPAELRSSEDLLDALGSTDGAWSELLQNVLTRRLLSGDEDLLALIAARDAETRALACTLIGNELNVVAPRTEVEACLDALDSDGRTATELDCLARLRALWLENGE